MSASDTTTRRKRIRTETLLPRNVWLLWSLLPQAATGFLVRTTTPTTTSFAPHCHHNAGWFDRRTSLRFLYQDHNDDDDEDDDDEPPHVDVSQFHYNRNHHKNDNHNGMISFGYNTGRSSPSSRKAMGRSSSGVAKVHLCSNCGSEFVKWMGRCPTCKEWNTLQEHAVVRQQQPPSFFDNSFGAAAGRPVFGSTGGGMRHTSSWLDGLVHTTSGESLLGHGGPVRMTDLYDEESSRDNAAASGQTRQRRQRRRIQVPNDDEFNNVLGGGIMPGSLVLVGGDPGVGKSTLLLQTAGSVASLATPTPAIGMGLPDDKADMANDEDKMGPVWYNSGEESPEQIASRSQRLGIDSSELWLLSETHADSLCQRVVQHLYPTPPPQPPPRQSKHGPRQKKALEDMEDQDSDHDDTDIENDNDNESSYPMSSQDAMFQPLPPSLLVIDSIQTMTCEAGGHSAAGGVTQVRECVALFLRLAKSTGIPILLVGHVTKSGDVAGPRTVEHMVDSVLYLEGSVDPAAGMNRLRILRASKNRFGSSEEVGVYEMTAGRLLPISDPSSLFLSHRASEDEDAEGCAIAIALEGMRAMTVEVQALVTMASSASGFGRRTVDGVSNSRLMLLLGVLQKRCGHFILKNDVYVNIAGKMRLDRSEGNAVDLAVAVSLVSSHTQVGVRADTAFVGEVGLLGELRSVESMEKRLQEAKRMGFSRVISPMDASFKSKPLGSSKKASSVHTWQKNGIEWIQCRKLKDAIQAGLVGPLPAKKKRSKSVDKKKSGNAKNIPGSLKDLGLDEIIDDEEDDEYDDGFL